MLLTVTSLIGLFGESVKGYAVEKFLDMCISAFTSKGKSIEEQFIYCVNKALMRFGQKYGFEYNIDKEEQFFTNIFQQGEFLSDEMLIHILKTTVYLEFDDKLLNEWLDLY